MGGVPHHGGPWSALESHTMKLDSDYSIKIKGHYLFFVFFLEYHVLYRNNDIAND